MKPLPGRATLLWLSGLSLLVVLGAMILALALGFAARDHAAKRAIQGMAARAEGLAHRLDADLALFDLALRDAAHAPNAATPARLRPLEHPLIARHAGFLNLLNEAGDVVADSRAGAPRPTNYAGRDYFQAQRGNPGGGLLVGRPFALAPGQHPMVPLSRRLTDAEGRFAGVAVAGVRLSWLREALAAPPAPAGALATIRREDGVILMRLSAAANGLGAGPEGTGGATLESPLRILAGDANRAIAGDAIRAASDDAGRPVPDDVGRGAEEPAWREWRRTGVAFVPDGADGPRLFRPLGGPGAPLVLELALDRAALAAQTPLPLPWLLALVVPSGLCALGFGALTHRFRRHALRVEAAAHHAKDEHRRLLATMSHELRTPLTSLLGQAELMRDEGGLDQRQAARLATLADAGALMRHVVNRVIDLTRPDDRAVPLALEPYDLDALVRRCRGQLEARARDKGLRLGSHVDPSVPRGARLSREIEQVLGNLLHNAVKFTVEGTVELRLTGDAARLRFEVADTGPGVARGKRHRLFQAYDRLDESDARSEGTGLGLSISEDLVRRMGGRIGHRDNPGGGSVFWVEVPTEPVSEPIPKPLAGPVPAPDAPPPAAPWPNGSAEGTLRVLVADDLELTRAVAAAFLRASGHAVTEVPDGIAAAHAAAERDFDVVVTDMRMPGCDGVETARRIRALKGRRARVPIVLVTADLEARHLGSPEETGIDACLIKPFTRPELIAAVEGAARLRLPDDDAAPPLLDEAVLAQLRDGLGADATEAHVQAAMRRIEDLLALLEHPRAMREERTRDAVHDLVGVAGLIGLGALAASLRRFGPGEDGDAALREVAMGTLGVLRRGR